MICAGRMENWERVRVFGPGVRDAGVGGSDQSECAGGDGRAWLSGGWSAGVLVRRPRRGGRLHRDADARDPVLRRPAAPHRHHLVSAVPGPSGPHPHPQAYTVERERERDSLFTTTTNTFNNINQWLNWGGGSRGISTPPRLIWDPPPLTTDPHLWF